MTRLALPLKTYSHLAGARKVPSEYELCTTGLYWHVAKGFAVETPAARWHQRYSGRSQLVCRDWSSFRDPRETSYSRYTDRRANQETLVAGLAESAARSGLVEAPGFEGWERRLARVIGPARFVAHGFQMIAAYVGQLAPEARITIVAMFQAADEMRRIHHLAYRLGQIRGRRPDAADGRAAWQGQQDGACWQPLRRALETALVAYDWGEALVALNLCLKPAVDGLLLGELSRTARASGDYPFGDILASLEQDARWHAEWTEALVRLALADRPENRAVIGGWASRWLGPAEQAVTALAETLWPEETGAVIERVRGGLRGRLQGLELVAS